MHVSLPPSPPHAFMTYVRGVETSVNLQHPFQWALSVTALFACLGVVRL